MAAVWLVDPVRFEPAIARARELGEMTAVLQLLDRHNRDCDGVAAELGVPHRRRARRRSRSPFETIPLKRTKRWRETALWWPAQRTLVVAEAIGTNRFFAADGDAAGVHLLLRLSPPRDALARRSSPNTCSSGTARACTDARQPTGSARRSTTPAAGFRAWRFTSLRSRSTPSAAA